MGLGTEHLPLDQREHPTWDILNLNKPHLDSTTNFQEIQRNMINYIAEMQSIKRNHGNATEMQLLQQINSQENEQTKRNRGGNLQVKRNLRDVPTNHNRWTSSRS